MVLKPSRSNPHLAVSRPKNLVLTDQIGNNRVRSSSVDLLSPVDDISGFFTPRATFKKDKPFDIPSIVVEDDASISPASERKISDVNPNNSFSNLSDASTRRQESERFYNQTDVRDLLNLAKKRLRKISFQSEKPLDFSKSREAAGSSSSINETRVQFALSQTPPMSSLGAPQSNKKPGGGNSSHHTLSPVIHCFTKEYVFDV